MAGQLDRALAPERATSRTPTSRSPRTSALAVGSPLRNVPRVTGSAMVVYEDTLPNGQDWSARRRGHPRGRAAGRGLHHAGRGRCGPGAVPAARLHDGARCSARWSVTPPTRLVADVDNLFDTTYYASSYSRAVGCARHAANDLPRTPHPLLTMTHAPSQAPVLDAVRAYVAGYGARTILDGLDLAVHAGEISLLLGANGAGKYDHAEPVPRVRVAQARARARAGRRPCAPRRGCTRRRLGLHPRERRAVRAPERPRERGLPARPGRAARVGRRTSTPRCRPPGSPRTPMAGASRASRKACGRKVSIALALARHVPALLLDEPTPACDPQRHGGVQSPAGHAARRASPC